MMFIQGQFVLFFKQVSFINILVSIFYILFCEIVTTNACIYKPTFVYHNQNVKAQFATFQTN
jgi:intracellular septation protein A